MGLSLYTSRIVLKTLGVENYGIYSVVASISTLFLSLRTVFAEAIQRFLNYEKGRCNPEGEQEVFCIGVVLHIAIAILFCLLIGTLGSWYLNNKAVIPDGRIESAHFVFICGIVSSVFMILIIPYDAVIIANEKMNIYAWVSIADGVLRLFSAFALVFFPGKTLEAYAVLLTIIPLFNLFFYLLYCRRFPECHFRVVHSIVKFKEIFSFAGWSFVGNLSYTIAHEGLNLILNSFGGVIANAGRNIAYQVRSAVNQVSNNTILATKPYIIQSSVTSSDEIIWDKIILISRLSFFIMSITSLPIIVYCDYLLHLWLEDVPDYSVVFTQLVVCATVVRTLHGPLNLLYMAKGKIKRMIIIESILLLLLLPFSYFVLSFGLSFNWIFILFIFWEFIIVFVLAFNASKEFSLPFSKYFKEVIIFCFLSSGISFVIGVCFYHFLFANSFWGLLINVVLLVAILSMVNYFLLLNQSEKRLCKGLVSSLRNK